MRIHFFQHVSFETPAFIGRWASEQGFSLATTMASESKIFPSINDFDALVVLGGPMSVYDELPWLDREKEVINDAIREGKKVLGICLGAQLIASVLGARVYPGEEKEIGWFPVHLSSAAPTSRLLQGVPEHFLPLHWHGDTFDLPKGATLLASSELTERQAFSLGTTVLGLQFHLEMQREDAEAIVKECSGDLTPGYWIQSAREILGDAAFSRESAFRASEEIARVLLGNFFSGVIER